MKTVVVEDGDSIVYSRGGGFLTAVGLPLLAIGGRMVVHKGEQAPAEAARAAGAIEILGGRLVDVRPYAVPARPGPRFLVVADKVRPTPDAYPRPPGRPTKRPLT